MKMSYASFMLSKGDNHALFIVYSIVYCLFHAIIQNDCAYLWIITQTLKLTLEGLNAFKNHPDVFDKTFRPFAFFGLLCWLDGWLVGWLALNRAEAIARE